MISLPEILRVKKGFTLIELLVVIGILAILLSIVLIAINPARQFGQANNTRRRSDVTQILNAIGAYSADNKGVLPTSIPLDTAVGSKDVSKANIDLCAALVPNYIPALPQDPQTGNGTSITDCASTYDTGYTVVKDANNRVTVAAPGAENSEVISNTR
jgi:prepilin-type N-terminal cleavage/methylation domain-containing protein